MSESVFGLIALPVGLGFAYVVLGVAYLTGRVDRLKRSLGVSLARLQGTKGAWAFGLIFAFNIPACAGPLLVALLGAAAVAQANQVRRGFLMLSVFGLALSLPIAVAVLHARGRAMLERIARYSQQAPRVIGAIFIILGLWSIRLAVVAEIL